MRLTNLITTLLLVALPLVSNAENVGKYVGTVQTQWLEDGRRMRLLSQFSYIDSKGIQWVAPEGWTVDGASIPRLAWTVIGGPFEGKYRNASVIHDVACDQKTRPWESVHEVFFEAMLTSGVEIWRAKVMYAAVYHFGPRWPRQVRIDNIPVTRMDIVQMQALANASAGSTATIISWHERARTALEILTSQPVRGDFDVRIEPPQHRLTEADFEKLKEAIINRELSATGGISLEDIRTYQP